MRMSPGHRDIPGGESEPAPASRLSEADRMVLLAARAWAGAGGEGATPQALAARLWDRLEPSQGYRLRDAWGRGALAATAGDPRSAWGAIQRAHQAEARVDAGRVHPSWWVRALRGESPAVQR